MLRPTDAETTEIEREDDREPDMAIDGEGTGDEDDEGRNIGTCCLGLGRRGVSSVAGRMDIPCLPQMMSIMTRTARGPRAKRRKRSRMKRTRKRSEACQQHDAADWQHMLCFATHSLAGFFSGLLHSVINYSAASTVHHCSPCNKPPPAAHEAELLKPNSRQCRSTPTLCPFAFLERCACHGIHPTFVQQSREHRLLPVCCA